MYQWRLKLWILNLEWDEGHAKGYSKNLYLYNLSSVLDDLKLIGKLFQRSTTFLLMMRSNSNDFEGEFMIEGKKVVFFNFSETYYNSASRCIRKSTVGLLTSECLSTLVRIRHSRTVQLEVGNPNADFTRSRLQARNRHWFERLGRSRQAECRL